MMDTPEINQSATIGALAAALAAAQAKIGNAQKTAQNPHLKSRYADLAAVREAVMRPLAEQGIAVVQTMEPHGPTGVCVVTTLMHSSGEWIRGRCFLPVPESKNPAQAFGSALTYARRYSLAAIVGVAADDDDGEAAAPQAAPSAPASAQAPEDRAAKAREAIAACKSVEELERLGSERLSKSPKEIQAAVAGDYAQRLSALKGKAA